MDGRPAVDGGAGAPLLSTKFLPPRTRERHVRRERLHDCLDRASSTPITLVSAPAGWGKSALVAAWLADLPVDRWAWLSLDARDNDVARIWAYLIEALRGLCGDVGDDALTELLRAQGREPLDGWLGLLINELVEIDRPTSYLVVDDFHLITDAEIRASVTLFAASMPSWLRLVIVTRSDPPLPLPRLRAEGTLTEVRQSDLRFEVDEAASLLRTEGVDRLDDDQLTWLMDRTEGWVAGLQLAVIVMGSDPSPERLREVAGRNRMFADYIIAEVVDVASEDLRTFLYATSVLDRVNPSLAVAVSGLDDARSMLHEAQERGLFLVALDERGEWFRYHALFAEAVQADARLRAPEMVRRANENAARWFEDRDDPVTALEHWCAAARPDEALRIAFEASIRLMDSGQVTSLERLAALIPESVVGDDADLQLDYALLHHSLDAERTRWWVDEAEKTIGGLEVPDERLVRRQLAIRAISDLLFGQWDDAVGHAVAAVGPLGVGEGDTVTAQRAGLQLLRAKAWAEEPDAAEELLGAYLRNAQTSPVVRDFLAPCAWVLAAAIGGRIHEAEIWHARATGTDAYVAGTHGAHQYLLLSRAVIDRERGDHDSVVRSIDAIRSAHTKTYHGLRAVAEIELAMSLGSVDRSADAAQVLDDLERTPRLSALGPRIHAGIHRACSDLHLGAGDTAKARRAVERMPGGFWREATIAKVLLAEGAPDHAVQVLSPLSPTSPRQRVTASLLHAIAIVGQDRVASVDRAEVAMKLAANEGMLDTVVSAARGFADVLEPASAAVPNDWMNGLRSMLAEEPRGSIAGRVPTLVEQPTDRERTVLRYLASRLTAAEIAREMGIAPSTLKSHLKSLYRKLDVASREEAVAAARRLGLIG